MIGLWNRWGRAAGAGCRAILILTVALAGCSTEVDVDDERVALLRQHQADTRAHLDRDVDALLATIPDDMIVTGDGNVFHQNRDQVREFFTGYLEGADYSRYEDLMVPHAEVSADGTMGWVISRQAVERSEPDPEGGRRDRAFTYAGIMTYEKTGGRWMKVANVSTFAPADDPELTALAAEDQLVRTREDHGVARTDAQRRERVFALLAGEKVRTPRDRFHAALILDHTGLTLCDGELTSVSPENCRLAHELARAAFRAGEQDAGWLTAATIDRYLGFTTGTQRYGTNRVINQESGVEELIPIDRSVSDEERAVYGVPPLAELLARWPERR